MTGVIPFLRGSEEVLRYQMPNFTLQTEKDEWSLMRSSVFYVLRMSVDCAIGLNSVHAVNRAGLRGS